MPSDSFIAFFGPAEDRVEGLAGLGVAARGALDLIRPLAMPLAAITVGDVSESFLKVDSRLSHISQRRDKEKAKTRVT